MAPSAADPLNPTDQADPGKAPDNNAGICEFINKRCETTNKICSTLFSITKLVLLFLVFLLAFQIINQIMSQPDDGIAVHAIDSNIGTNINGAVLADRLQIELQGIKDIYRQSLKASTLHTISQASYSSTVSLPSISSDKIKILHDPGTISAGGVSLSPLQVLYFLRDLTGKNGRPLLAGAQRFGSNLTLFAVLYGADSSGIDPQVWKVSQCLSKNDQLGDEPMPAMIETLAFKVVNSLINSDKKYKGKYPRTWEAFQYLTRGREAYLSYNITKSIKDLDKAKDMTLYSLNSEPCSESANLLYAIGITYLDINRLEEARQLFKNISNILPAESAFGLGMAHVSERNYLLALDEFNKSIEKNSSYVDAWISKGGALVDLGRYNESIQASYEAIKLDPKYAVAWNNLGLAHYLKGNFNESIEAYSNATKFNPQYVDAWYNEGVAYNESTKYEAAVHAFDNASKLAPENARILNNKGVSLYMLKKNAEAIQTYDKAIRLDPKNPIFWNNKGEALIGLNEYHNAIDACNTAISLSPSYTAAWNTKGIALKALNRTAEANDAFAKAKNVIKLTA